MRQTHDFDRAQEWATELFGSPNLFETWMPAAGFVKAVGTASSLAFTRGVEEPYGLGLGDGVEIDPTWKNFSIPRSIASERTAEFVLTGQWDAYVISTSKFTDLEIDGHRHIPLSDDQEIAEFLNIHAPESSTKPGHPEIVFWSGLRNTSGELLAVAALTQWESGSYVLSSVAVHQDHRGEGLAQSLTRAVLIESAHNGISKVALGVAGKNAAAIAVYEKVGFICMGRFNYFELG